MRTDQETGAQNIKILDALGATASYFLTWNVCSIPGKVRAFTSAA